MACLLLTGCPGTLSDIPANLIGSPNIRILTDAEIANVAQTLNDAEIAAARTAQPRLVEAPLMAFAQKMIDTHAAANARMAQLAAENIIPFDNRVSQALRQVSETGLGQLNATPAPQVDEVYLRSQLTEHSTALTLIDCALARSVENATLQVLVAQMRVDIESHLLEGLQLEIDLGIPDRGEGSLVRCADVCETTGEGQVRSARFPAVLKSSICK